MFETEETTLKECPFCGGSLQKGIIESFHSGSLFNASTFVRFYPEDEKGNFIKKNATSLKLKSNGYYCEACWKFIGVYEQR